VVPLADGVVAAAGLLLGRAAGNSGRQRPPVHPVPGQRRAIWFKYWNGSVWSAWAPVPGGSGFQSGPAATAYRPPGAGGTWHLQVYALGWDGGMYEQLYDFGTMSWWPSWNPVGGAWTSAPAALGRDRGDL